MTKLTLSLIALSTLLGAASAGVLDKQKALETQTFWDNRDWEWYKANIPFFECPDEELVTTYYYRWELITKHMTYGSPNSGYSFTEFTDRPFWSGAYGAISCPVGHQLYELRWLADDRYTRDYSRYWFRTPGAQPRNYGCWLADGIWAMHQVHPDDAFMVDLLPDLKKNYEEWTKRQFVPEVGLFWQNGHDDGMEFNINSRQTTDILRGAPGYRPGFNAYMYADALSIARTARLAGDTATAEEYEKKASSLKEKVQQLLWDPKREFYFPMSMREEKDKEGVVVAKHTLTYQSGRHAGSPHGREEHGYIPWQFNMVDPGRESAWKFLMDRNYFYADFGPTTVERHDPMFLLQKGCCWWSGQSWPYSTAQTLKAMANVLHQYPQDVISRADYVKLLQIFSKSHRKEGKPYLAEALHPDTGSFEGHDGYNHSEHYFHSSFNDLVITGLAGLKSRADDTLEIDPLFPQDWAFFAMDDIPYRGRKISILWDRDGSRYGKGTGLRVLADDREIASAPALGKLTVKLPDAAAGRAPAATVFNYAVNNDGDYWPKFAATFTADKTSLNRIHDGHAWYTIHPPNRWTAEGSPNATDAVAVELGMKRRIDTVKLYFLDDSKGVTAPAAYTLESWDGSAWQEIPQQQRQPEKPEGHRANITRFPALETDKVRAVFTHGSAGQTGLTEFEIWGPGERPYTAAPPPAGNLALNQKGEGFPQATASHHDTFGGLPKLAIDGRTGYLPTPVNRWTCYGSKSPSDWLEVDFGSPKEFQRLEIGFFDDRGGVQAPESYTIEYFDGSTWKPAANQRRSPEKAVGGAMNSVRFDKVTAAKVRLVCTHKGEAKSGVTELEVWND
ncbi:MAG: MGH1-like glycoside hydrolase domain-containing protein [Verrucomicrobiota bacterium]